nr:hypothetical protein [uncultured Campylobacter sp.]
MTPETRFGFLNLIATCACFGIGGRELRHKFNARGVAVEILSRRDICLLPAGYGRC